MATYDYPTNFSGGQNISSVSGVFSYANYVTNGTFGSGILVVIFLISFMASMVVNARKAMMSSLFITFIFSVFFMRLQMVPIYVVILIMIAFIISVILGAKEGSSSL